MRSPQRSTFRLTNPLDTTPLNPIRQLPQVATIIDQVDDLSDATSNLDAIRNATFLFAAVQALAAIFLIVNMVQITAFNRRQETEIMRMSAPPAGTPKPPLCSKPSSQSSPAPSSPPSPSSPENLGRRQNPQSPLRLPTRRPSHHRRHLAHHPHRGTHWHRLRSHHRPRHSPLVCSQIVQPQAVGVEKLQ